MFIKIHHLQEIKHFFFANTPLVCFCPVVMELFMTVAAPLDFIASLDDDPTMNSKVKLPPQTQSGEPQTPCAASSASTQLPHIKLSPKGSWMCFQWAPADSPCFQRGSLTAAAHGWMPSHHQLLMAVPATLSGGQSVLLSGSFMVGVFLPPASHTVLPQGHTPCSSCPVLKLILYFDFH